MPTSVVCVAPSAIIDHLSVVTPAQLAHILGNEPSGGSSRITLEQARRLLEHIGSFSTRAAGSVANVARNLATLGIPTRLITTRGQDEWGGIFHNAMQRAKVDVDHVMVRGACTGRSVVMACNGARTMRTFMDEKSALQASDLRLEMFDWDGPQSTTAGSSACQQLPLNQHLQQGLVFAHSQRLSPRSVGLQAIRQELAHAHSSNVCDPTTPGSSGRPVLNSPGSAGMQWGSVGGSRWVFVSAYALRSGQQLLQRAVELARQADACIALDLASYEVVQEHLSQLKAIIEQDVCDIIIGNEDEAAALMGQPVVTSASNGHSNGHTSQDRSVQNAALEYLAAHSRACVVTLGADGCMAACGTGALGEWPGLQQARHIEPSVSGVEVVDSTGAGDAFTAGFLYGAMRGLPLARCARLGCAAGASAVRVIGSELTPADWQYFHHSVRGPAASSLVEGAAAEVHLELLEATALVERLGRGVVYFGSARLGEGSPYYERVVELAREVALLLRSTCWTGGGPGMMRAASEGGLAAGCVAVGGIKISREAGQDSVLVDDYLAPGASMVCKHMPSRKAALMDAGIRLTEADRTAYVFLPGGLGTLDELFALLTLIQLNKLGSRHPIPCLILNLDGFYDGLISLLAQFESDGVLARAELRTCMVANDCSAALNYLLDFYALVPRGACRSPGGLDGQDGPVLVTDDRSSHHSSVAHMPHVVSLSAVLAASVAPSTGASVQSSKPGSAHGSVHNGL